MLLLEVSASHGMSVVRAIRDDLPASLRPVSCTQPWAYQYSATSNSHSPTTPARRGCQRSTLVGWGSPPARAAASQAVREASSPRSVGPPGGVALAG